MLESIKSLKLEIEGALHGINSADALEKFRLEFLVKKGKLQELFDKMKDAPKEEKPLLGKELNVLRNYVESEFNSIKASLLEHQDSSPSIDLTLPGRHDFRGSKHPVIETMQEMISIFDSMGFAVAEGPEIEDGYHNFDALNFPPDHPARDMQDTFFIKSDKELLLRTHTSPVQIRVMKSQKPPIRCIMPGRVYRNESINARSLAEFHQIEGLYINKKVTFAELKGTLMTFAKKMYGEDSQFRFRPSFFPFTEPSAELDMSCFLCKGKGCRICKHTGWLEILGCGMVHPNVLREGGIDPEEYSGYAFGFGIERVALLRTGIDDIRLLYENDVRVIGQF
jgi:phenylalanyl-tRNA synthetase alpha chain